MGHTVFIVLHATAATVALLAGAVALPAGRLFEVYRWGQIGMVATLVPALAIAWPGYPLATRIAYGGLLVLAVVMFVRATLAGRMLPSATGGPTARYIDHVGFTLIALSDGFAIVALLRAGAPAWLVAGTALAVIAVGHFALVAAKARLVHPTPSRASTPA
jgi:hypothetical protein